MAGNLAQAAPSLCTAVAGNLVTNCGFESGDFTGWTLGGNLEGPPPASLGPGAGFGNNYYGVDNTNPHTGTYEGYFGVQSGPSSVPPTAANAIYPITLSQTLSLLPAEYYSVSFYLDQDGPTPGPNCPDPDCTNYFDVDFNGLQLYAVKDQANTNGYIQLQFTTSTGLSGNSGLLQFDFQNNDDFWFFDDVAVTPLGPTPEPASWLLVGPTLIGLLLLVRRWNKRTA